MAVGPVAALALTLAIELPAGAAVVRPGTRAATAWTLLFANLVTHPVAWWLVSGSDHPERFWPVELCVLAAEVLALVAVARTPFGRAVAVAGVANGLTVGLSLML